MSFSYVTSGMFVTVLTVKLENGSTTKEIVAQRRRRQLESARSEIRGLVDHAARHVLTVRSGVAAVEGADGVVGNARPAPPVVRFRHHLNDPIVRQYEYYCAATGSARRPDLSDTLVQMGAD